MAHVPNSPRLDEPKRSPTSDASEPQELPKTQSANWRSHANALANAAHHGQQTHRRSSSGRTRGSTPSTHRRQFSYPGTASAAARPPQHLAPYPQGGYPMGGYPAGVRVHGQYGSADGAEYGGFYPAAAYPYPVAPWMAGYDWSSYGMYVMNPLQACRSERSTRVVYVANVAASVDDAALQEAAAKFGDIRGYDASQREASSGVFVSFYDVRHAEAAVKALPELLPGLGPEEQSPCVAYFMMPSMGVAGMENQGTVSVSDAGQEITNTEVKALFAKFGDIRSVWETNPPAPEFRFVEFFDTRCAEAALLELKMPDLKGCKLRLEFAPFAGLEPVQHASYGQQQQQQQHYPLHPPPATGEAAQDGSPTMQSPYQSAYAAWAAAYPPHPHQHHHTYSGESYLTPRASAPEMGEYTRGQEGVWTPQGYMGYGGPYWPYAAQPMMQPMYNEMMAGRTDENSSPNRHSNSSDSHNWRPHRISRSSGDRSYDPSQFEFSLDEASGDKPKARTTLMIRNIPNKYSQKMLLDVLNRKYSSSYDFFYLPIDFKNRCNLGYAFVNFCSPAKTAQFYKEFHAKAWEEFNSKKVCEITYARVQGKDALVEHFRNSRFPCNDADYLPLVFDNVQEGESEGDEESKADGAKGTPVHNWANSQQYGNSQTVVAAH